MPGEELQRHHAVVWEVEEIDRVDDLLRRNVQVDYTEVVLQSMTDEYYATEIEFN